jgi:predicted RNase H-like nuclease (RuvC/YqgF family)
MTGAAPHLTRENVTMNKQRRKELAAIIADFENLTQTIDHLRERIEAVKDEEQDAFDNLPESLQEGERGQQMQTAIDAMDNAISDLETIDVDSITSSLEEAGE